MPPLAIPPVAYEQMFPAMMAHYMQHMAQLMPMFQPPPPPQPQPRIVTFKMLKDNGAEEFRGDKKGEPQIALDWLEQMDRVLKNLRVPDADRSELASQMFWKGAYDWWKRIDQDPHTPKPWTWDRFDRAFTKEYVPTRYREERRDEFVALKQEGMSLPELRQKFDYLSQYATSLVSTPEDRLNEFVKKLRPDLRPYAALITTTDFNAAYDLIVKTEKSLDDLQATKKEDRATKGPRPAANTGPSGKSFGFGGKRKLLAKLQLQSPLEQEIRTAQRDDEFCQKTRELVLTGKKPEFAIRDDGVLYYRERLVVPRGEVRDRLLREAHGTVYTMHPGSNKMYQDLKKSYWWPAMKKEISEF
ncbi:unnamed protein product, partial [Cuscuta campestris]